MKLVQSVLPFGRSCLVGSGSTKKLILAAIAGTCAVSVFAQGTIVFNNWVPGRVQTRIYAPHDYISLIGNGTNDLPAGTTDWTGFTLIGANGNNVRYGGNTTFAALLAAPGLNQPESSLLPATTGGITSFRTGLAAGIIYGTTPTFNNIPPDFAGGATVEMVAWDNSSGLYSTWALAREAWLTGRIDVGVSGAFNITETIGGVNVPPYLLGLRSFNIWSIPEPSSLALACLGAAALMIGRRRR